MIGLEFEANNECGSLIAQILENISTKNYTWYIPFEEVIDLEGKYFFHRNMYEDQIFREKVKDNYYIVHMIAQGQTGENPEINIQSYDEYLSSSCKIIISIIDTTMVKIYCKDKRTIEKIETNAKSYGYTNIKYIYEEGDYKNYFKKMIIDPQ